MLVSEIYQFTGVIDSICELHWSRLKPGELEDIAIMYFYFSVLFRENLQIARTLYPDDEKLAQLEQDECNTDNLSPWPGVAHTGERMDHDEFMRRVVLLSPVDGDRRSELDAIGQPYLAIIRKMDPDARARSIASCEDRGLERVFGAILTSEHWGSDSLRAFKHFLLEHLRFDADPEHGHGALARHLKPNDDVLLTWTEFRRILVEAVPALIA